MTLIPFDQREGVIWHDGKMVPWRDASVHVLTHGLHYASSVFEGIRAYQGAMLKLEEHIDRLIYSAEILAMSSPFTKAELMQACHDVLAQNSLSNAYLRPVMWRGSEQMGVSGMQAKPHVAIAAWDWGPAFSADISQNGMILQTASWRRPPPECAPVHSKAAGLYMIATLSKQQAEQNGAHDALLLDWRGQVSEASSANIFFIMNGILHTPKPDCFLDGITRQTVIQIARSQGLEVVERGIMPEEMIEAQEVFLTGTAYEIMPVRKIDTLEFPSRTITHNLQQAYYTLAGRTK